MSIAPAKTIQRRIRSAKRNSPLALFRVPDENICFNLSKNKLEAVFANTVMTQARIRRGDRLFIGVYHGLGGAERFIQEWEDAG